MEPPSMLKVGIIECTIGGSAHFRTALQSLGHAQINIESPEDVAQAQLIVFVSSRPISSVLQVLQDKGLTDPLRQYLLQDRPFLGVGTGMHVLFESSDDHPDSALLNVLPGSVTKLEAWDVSVPHLGWNGVTHTNYNVSLGGGASADAEQAYFAHSYCVTPGPENMELIRGVTDHGDQRFISIVNKGRVTGVQFHPERSGLAGLNFLRDYLRQYAVPEDAVTVERVVLEDFGELQALPVTVPACRVAVVATSAEETLQLHQVGADEVLGATDVAGADGVFLPVSTHCSEGTGFDSAEKQLAAGASRVVVSATDIIQTAVDFLSTGVATGESTIERLSRLYGTPAVVVEIKAQRVLMENPMKPFKRPDTDSSAPDSASAPCEDPFDDSEAFPTLSAAHSAGHASSTGSTDEGMVQIIAEAEEEHDVLGMLRGMGRTVVHLEQELAEQFEAQGEPEGDLVDGVNAQMPLFTHCSFSVLVPSGEHAGKLVDAVVLAKVCETLGAGEILLRGSGDRPFDVALINAVQNAVNISVLAAPAAGVHATREEYTRVFERTRVKAVLLEQGVLQVGDLKAHLHSVGVSMRIL